MRHCTPVLLLAALALSAPALGAQLDLHGLYRIMESPVWTSQLPTTTPFRDLCIGKFTSLYDPDAAVLRGGELKLAVAMASRNKAATLDTGVTAMVRLPGQGNNGLDALMTTGPDGLKLRTYVDGPTPAWVATVNQSTAHWTDVTKLCLGASNVYGLAGNTVRVATQAGESLGSFALSATAVDFCLLAFVTGQEDLAVAYAHTIEVRLASTGQVIWSPAPGTYLNNHIVASRGHGEPDYLFWYGEFVYGGTTYPLFDVFNAQRTDPLQVPPQPCGGLVSFDYDGPGTDGVQRDDVLFSAANSQDVYLFRRQPGSSQYIIPYSLPQAGQPADVFDLPEIGTIPTVVAGGDIDNDGDNDPLFAQAGNWAILRSALNLRVNRADLAPRITDTEFLGGVPPNSPVLGFTYEKSPYLPSSATKIEVEVRRLNFTDAHLFWLHDYDLPASGPATIYLDLPTSEIDSSKDAVQLILREKDSSAATAVRYPTTTYFYHLTSDAWSTVWADNEVRENIFPTATPNYQFGTTPGGTGYTQGSGGHGPQTP